jgi:hypothetical protein
VVSTRVRPSMFPPTIVTAPTSEMIGPKPAAGLKQNRSHSLQLRSEGWINAPDAAHGNADDEGQREDHLSKALGSNREQPFQAVQRPIDDRRQPHPGIGQRCANTLARTVGKGRTNPAWYADQRTDYQGPPPQRVLIPDATKLSGEAANNLVIDVIPA